MPGKISKQCRERWHNHLDPKIKKTKWSLEEDLILYILQKNHGNKWTEIAQILEGRAENTIKNHWNASMSKKVGIIQHEIEARLNEACNEAEIEYLSCFAENTEEYPESFKEFFANFQNELLSQLIREVKLQDQQY